ncbi:unnamed protein product, partial [Brenthis ino]
MIIKEPLHSSGTRLLNLCPNYPDIVSSCPNPIWRHKSTKGARRHWRGHVTQTFSVLRLTLSSYGVGRAVATGRGGAFKEFSDRVRAAG